MKVHSINEIRSGEVVLVSANSGSGKFSKIREIAAKNLQKSGDAIMLRDLVSEIKSTFEFETRKANNYARNALNSKASAFDLEKIQGIVFVIKK